MMYNMDLDNMSEKELDMFIEKGLNCDAADLSYVEDFKKRFIQDSLAIEGFELTNREIASVVKGHD